MTVNEFKIYTVWKGEFNETTYLSTYNFGSSCAGGATVGEEYIVYGGFRACSRTRRLSNAQEDLAELGAGQSPVPGTSAPLPESVQAIKNASKPGQEQSPTLEVIPPTPLAAEEGQMPTPTPRPATPRPTPAPATPNAHASAGDANAHASAGDANAHASDAEAHASAGDANAHAGAGDANAHAGGYRQAGVPAVADCCACSSPCDRGSRLGGARSSSPLSAEARGRF